jgi:hypothetical protein
MKKILVSLALVLCTFAATATAALANVSFQGYVLDSTGRPTSGAQVQLWQLSGVTYVNVATCTSGATGLYNCGSHIANTTYFVYPSRAVNCMLLSGYWPVTAIGSDVHTVTWYPALTQAKRVC